MRKLHPKVLKKNGKSEFVIFSYEEFLILEKCLEDAFDILSLRRTRREDDPSVPSMTLEEVREHLGLTKAAVKPKSSLHPRSVRGKARRRVAP